MSDILKMKLKHKKIFFIFVKENLISLFQKILETEKANTSVPHTHIRTQFKLLFRYKSCFTTIGFFDLIESASIHQLNMILIIHYFICGHALRPIKIILCCIYLHRSFMLYLFASIIRLVLLFYTDYKKDCRRGWNTIFYNLKNSRTLTLKITKQ